MLRAGLCAPCLRAARPRARELLLPRLSRARIDRAEHRSRSAHPLDRYYPLQPGRLTLTATGHAFLLSGPIVVVSTPAIVDGKVGAQIESATLAGVGLPYSTKQDIADTFARTLASNIPSGTRVTSITVNMGTMVVLVVPS